MPSRASRSTSNSYAHLQRPGDRTENPVRGPATNLPAGPGAGPGETQSDSHFPRKIPGPFPCSSHALTSTGPGLGPDETGSRDQTTSISKVRRVDFGGCGPPQPPKSISEADGRYAGFSVVTSRAYALDQKVQLQRIPSYPLGGPPIPQRASSKSHKGIPYIVSAI